jgi:hypothetical protein
MHSSNNKWYRRGCFFKHRQSHTEEYKTFVVVVVVVAVAVAAAAAAAVVAADVI